MEWGIVMSVFTVGGMLMLIFAQPRDVEYQTFGADEVNPPIATAATPAPELRPAPELKKAA